jgi:hypothetical protein
MAPLEMGEALLGHRIRVEKAPTVPQESTSNEARYLCFPSYCKKEKKIIYFLNNSNKHMHIYEM